MMVMGCKCASYDSDSGRWDCYVSGSQCMYLMPDSKRCAEEYGEGPDAEAVENPQGFEMYIIDNQGRESKISCLQEMELEFVPGEIAPVLESIPTGIQGSGTLGDCWINKREIDRLCGIKNKRKRRYKQLDRARRMLLSRTTEVVLL